MSEKPHLISHELCPYVQRAVIVLTEKQVPFERTDIDLSAKPDWFLDLSPMGRVPVLRIGGTTLFESQVIADYLDDVTPGSLYPLDPLEKARHRAWIAFASETLNAIGAFYSAPDAAAFDAKRDALAARFNLVDREVDGPYFAGTSYHLVDGVWGTVFRYLDVFDTIADFGLLTDAPVASLWREWIRRRPSDREAPSPNYAERLMDFLKDRDSHISTLIRSAEHVPAG
ncbi:MAG: glutathione S-transferase family protein [Pseudomonadota bacterium]